MWVLSGAAALAGTFVPVLVAPPPDATLAQLRGQAVLDRSRVGRLTLDLGTARLVRPAERYALGVTGSLVGVGIEGAAASWFGGSAGAGIWVTRYSSHAAHHVGLVASAPVRPGLRSYGVLVQEAGTEVGMAYRWTVEQPGLSYGVSAGASISTVTVFGGAVGAHLTQHFASDRLGLQIEGLIGLSESAWMALGLHWRPSERVVLGLSAPTALPLVPNGGPVHVTPFAVLRVDAPLASIVPELGVPPD